MQGRYGVKKVGIGLCGWEEHLHGRNLGVEWRSAGTCKGIDWQIVQRTNQCLAHPLIISGLRPFLRQKFRSNVGKHDVHFNGKSKFEHHAL
jgi:hypothetical protein